MTSPYKVKIPVRDAKDDPPQKQYFQVLLRYNEEAPENKDIPENGTFRVTATVYSEGNTLQASVNLTVLGPP